MSSIITNTILIYLSILLFSVAYYMYKYDDIMYLVKNKAKEKGYKLNKNNFNQSYYITECTKALNPIYLFYKGNKLTKDKSYLNKYVDELIVSGNFTPVSNKIEIYGEDIKEVAKKQNSEYDVSLDNAPYSIFKLPPKVTEVADTPYKARKVDNSLYLSDEDALSYASNGLVKTMETNNDTDIVPEIIEIKEEIKEEEPKVNPITSYICAMSPKDLEELSESIKKLLVLKSK